MKTLHQEGELRPQPATSGGLLQCNRRLIRLGLSPIPAGYADFLGQNNGYAWNGYEFYGTHPVEDAALPSGGYCLADIASKNEEFHRNYGLGNKLLLGIRDISYFTYNAFTRRYEELESDSREVMAEFDDFNSLLARFGVG